MHSTDWELFHTNNINDDNNIDTNHNNSSNNNNNNNNDSNNNITESISYTDTSTKNASPPISTQTGSTLRSSSTITCPTSTNTASFRAQSYQEHRIDILHANTGPRRLIHRKTATTSLSAPSSFSMDQHERNDAPRDQVGDALDATTTAAASSQLSSRVEHQQEGDGEETRGNRTEAATSPSSSLQAEPQDPKAPSEESTPTQKRKRKPPAFPWKKPKDMPRRPLSAYNLFFKERREVMMKAASAAGDAKPSFGRKKSSKSVGIGFANLARTIGSEWKTLDPNARAPYETRAAAEKSRYDKEMLVWRAKQKQDKIAGGGSDGTGGVATSPASIGKPTSSLGGNDVEVRSPIAGGTGDQMATPYKSSKVPMHVASSVSLNPSVSQPLMPSSFSSQPMNLEEMTMMNQQYSIRQQEAGRQERSMMMDWFGQHPPAYASSQSGYPSAMHLSELSSAAIQEQRLRARGLAHDQVNPTQELENPHQLMMQQQYQQRTMTSNDAFRTLDDRNPFEVSAWNPSSRFIYGANEPIDEHLRHPQPGFGVPTPVVSTSTGDLPSPERSMENLMAFSGINPVSFSTGDLPPSGQVDNHGALAGRRKTWSGISQAQQDIVNKIQLERLRQEEDVVQQQLRQHRRRLMAHEQEVQEQRQRRASVQVPIQTEVRSQMDIAPDLGGARHVGQHPDFWTELRPDLIPNPSQSLASRVIQQPSSQVQNYPSTWFEADPNMESASKASIDDSPIRYPPDNDGDLNKKVSSLSKSTAPSTTLFGARQDSLEVEEGKKTGMDPWDRFQGKEEDPGAPESKIQSTTNVGGEDPMDLDRQSLGNDGVDPSSVQALGMRLDDESVNFLTNLRFGGGLNTPDESPQSGSD